MSFLIMDGRSEITLYLGQISAEAMPKVKGFFLFQQLEVLFLFGLADKYSYTMEKIWLRRKI